MGQSNTKRSNKEAREEDPLHSTISSSPSSFEDISSEVATTTTTTTTLSLLSSSSNIWSNLISTTLEEVMDDEPKHKKQGTKAQRVAIIGGGVSGLAAAWHLQNSPTQCSGSSSTTTVHVYESASQLGGHAYTVPVPTDCSGNTTNVDIGFMVFNHENYPNMVEWFQAMKVPTEQSDMSLSISLDGGKTVEWSSDGIMGLLGANWKQILQPSFYMFLLEMLRFNREASDILLLSDDDPRKHITTQQYLSQNNYSSAFATYYLLPMMAALWSASLQDVLQFPAAQLIGFLCNHKMLQLFDRPIWKTVTGRSQQYVSAVASALGPDHVHCNTPITAVHKNEIDGTYTLQTTNGTEIHEIFDQVIFACHPPTAAKILEHSGNNNLELITLLEQIEYADNVVYVHSDPSLMPRKAWASWNCLGKSNVLQDYAPTTSNMKKGESFEGGESGFGNTTNLKKKEHRSKTTKQKLEGADGRFRAVYVTYWLNRLQNLNTDQNIFVSLNPHHKPDPELTHKRVILAHPQFHLGTLEARSTLLEKYQGRNGMWFCGAWGGYGFHEDGCRSGFQVATALSGVPMPWAAATKSKNLMVLPPPDLAHATQPSLDGITGSVRKLYRSLTYDLPVAICKRFIYYFLHKAVKHGTLLLKFNDGTTKSFGDGTPCGCDSSAVTLRVFDPWFFVKTALEYDLGLSRSYMAGLFVVEPLEDSKLYHPVIKPHNSRNETTLAIGDPVGLTRLFLLLIGNRDRPLTAHQPKKSGRGHWYSGAFTNASGLVIGKVGSLLNYLRYKLTMDNSERGGSRKNIHAHYDLSNDLFMTFLDKETLMYSSAIYDAIQAPRPLNGLVFRGTLEEAQWRKLDTLLDRAQVQPGQTLLDIGFGWGGLAIHAAKKYGCRVTGITLSVEQKALAEQRVKDHGLESLMKFEVVDYRIFARRCENLGKFDRVLSCEMIEAVGHKHLGEFFWAVEQLLTRDGILVMEAITTPEERYENYIRSTDFINTIIFPGSCCPSLHALVDAAYKQSSLTLEHIDNIGLHYAQTLAEWRRRFNASEDTVRSMGFDDIFLRAWNYYLTYCEAGFFSQTENCLILVFSRPGCQAIVPLCETQSVTQRSAFTNAHTTNWLTDGLV